MHALSPPESVHALDLSKLRGPDISFRSDWDDQALLGCGVVRELDRSHGEVKSMRTPSSLRRRSAGRAILQHIVHVAKARGYIRLSFETGTAKAFEPADRLYESFGLAEPDLRLRGVRPANGPGNVLQVLAAFEGHTPTFTGHGERGVSAETVARTLADDVDAYLTSGACIDEHLADQLLLPMALAGGGSFTTTAASDHLRSNARLVEKFLSVEITLDEQGSDLWRVTVAR